MLKVFRGEILHFIKDPSTVTQVEQSYQYFADGLLFVEHGLVKMLGYAADLLAQVPTGIKVTQYQHGLIMPGFIDCHIHYPQTDMIASFGEQLLTWLEQYTFPQERKFADSEHATEVAQFFIDQLLSAGTTTALVFGTVHPQSVNAFFSVAQQHRLRMICGKVLMDRNCPDYLQDTAESGYQDSKALIERWHKVERLLYAVTPRFAPTSSKAQLDKAGQLLAEYPDVYLHSHVCENQQEIDWVQRLFPEADGYVDVYQQSQLLRKRSVLAHGVHLTNAEYLCLAKQQTALAFCPSSNLFLGSGLFSLKNCQQHQVTVGLGTDVGAGTSFSMLSTLNEAYKVQQLQGHGLDPFKAFYLATLGGAQALDLADNIGSFKLGNEADFIVLDYQATPLLARRIKQCQTLAEKLFAISMLGDDRHIAATYIMGQLYQAPTPI
jgi:guanine deaminase